MSEYICKEDLIKKLCFVTCLSPIDPIIQTIMGFPATDAKPEIHAYWIRGKEFGFKTHNPMWYCSNCGGSIRYNTTLRTYQKAKRPVQEVNCFCRKCGAKMDLEPIYEREEDSNG